MAYSKLKQIQGLPETTQTIFEIISSKEESRGVRDSKKPLNFTAEEVSTIRDKLYDQNLANIIAEGGRPSSVAETMDSLTSAVKKSLIQDGFYNPATGIGTEIDPSMYNSANIPISISPMEATSMYASGGVASVIINKKSYGLLTNGFEFRGDAWWDRKRLDTLKKYAITKHFDQYLGDALRDGLLYGGSLMVPALHGDNPISYTKSIPRLVKDGFLKKDSLDYFWTADRWNSVLIPDYNISASDYLTPKEIFVPITGLGVSTGRAAVLRPKKLPYWGTLRQMGWGISDIEGWVRSLLGYEIMVMTIPVMSQQMSLMYHHIPLDGEIAMSGPDAAKKIAQENARMLREWSSVNPRAVSAIGEIKVVNRSYTDYDKLMTIVRQDLSAKSGIAESILFHTQAQGFSNNDSDLTLKQAEILQQIGNIVAPQVHPVVATLAISCFGPEVMEHVDSLRLSFESPTVYTAEQKAEMGGKFFAMLANARTAELPLDIAVNIAMQFVPDVEISSEELDRLKGAAPLTEDIPVPSGLSDPDNPDTPALRMLRGEYSPENRTPVAALVKAATPIDRILGIFDSRTWSGWKLQGRTKIHGMDISIENKKGSTRKGTDKDGHKWSVRMAYDYGYCRKSEGVDGDFFDCYIGPNPDSKTVFVVNQNDPTTGKFDEQKAMIGFNSAEEAKEAYISHHDRPGFFSNMVDVDIDTFKKLIMSKRWKGKKVPFERWSL